MAPLVNALPKVVCSTTLEDAPWGDGEPAAVAADAEAHVRRLRAEPGGHALIWGSLALMRSLLAAGLIDVLELLVAPTRPLRPRAAPQRSSRKNARTSPSSSAGSSRAAKCPPRSTSVQRVMRWEASA